MRIDRILFIIMLFLLHVSQAQTNEARRLKRWVNKGNIIKVKEKIETNPELLNKTYRHNENLLSYALWSGQIETAKFLIEKGININLKSTKTLKTPLLISTTFRQHTITKLLVDKGANVNEDGRSGSTPLRNTMQLLVPIQDSDFVMFKYLVSNGADFKCICGNCCQANYLMHAAINNKVEIAKYLIGLGIDINQVSCQKYNALHFAVEYNHVEVTKLLLEKGLNPNDKTLDGRTVFDMAKRNKNEEILKLLSK